MKFNRHPNEGMYRVVSASGFVLGKPTPLPPLFKDAPVAPPRKGGRPRTRTTLERERHWRTGYVHD